MNFIIILILVIMMHTLCFLLYFLNRRVWYGMRRFNFRRLWTLTYTREIWFLRLTIQLWTKRTFLVAKGFRFHTVSRIQSILIHIQLSIFHHFICSLHSFFLLECHLENWAHSKDSLINMVAFKVKSLVSTFQYEKADFSGGWKAALQHPHLSDTPRIIFIVNIT